MKAPTVEEALRSSGQPLDDEVREYMEGRLGHDFAAVRVHTDSRGAQSALGVHARAYTVGSDIVFAEGQYNPRSFEGKRLLAHELTHVAQEPAPNAVHRQADAARRGVRATRPRDLPEEEVEEEEQPSREDEVGATATPEPVEPLPEAIYVAEDLVHEEERIGENGGVAPTDVVAADHPSEREAEEVSAAVVRPTGYDSLTVRSHVPIAQTISPSQRRRRLHRQIFWELQNTLGWGDFKAAPPKKSPFSAQTASGFRMAAWKTEQKADDQTQPCKIGKKPASTFRATASLDISQANLNVRAFMLPNKSWVRPAHRAPALLAHEQGHFDISNAISEKTEFAINVWGIQNVGEATKCGKQPARNAALKAWNALKPNKAIGKIFKKGIAVLKQAQDDYDGQTTHGTKAADQAAWQDQISVQLPNYEVL